MPHWYNTEWCVCEGDLLVKLLYTGLSFTFYSQVVCVYGFTILYCCLCFQGVGKSSLLLRFADNLFSGMK